MDHTVLPMLRDGWNHAFPSLFFIFNYLYSAGILLKFVKQALQCLMLN